MIAKTLPPFQITSVMCAVQQVFMCNFTLLLFLVHLWVDKNHVIIFCMAA